MEFSHYGQDNQGQMVDVLSKTITNREAKACGKVLFSAGTVDLIKKELLPKGNPFEVARISGIMAAKQTANLIPMCHPLALTYIDVEISLDEKEEAAIISSVIRLKGVTGVEMEALTAVTVAALTIYDMCKAVDKGMVISGVELVKKSGGKSDLKKSDFI